MSEKTTAEVKELTFDELEKLVFTKKANAFQKMEYFKLATENTEKELEKEKDDRIEQIFDLMEKLEITKQDLLDKLKAPPVMIFSWNGKNRFEGERGKLPAWTADLKKISKDEALKFVVNNNEKGKKFIETLYK